MKTQRVLGAVSLAISLFFGTATLAAEAEAAKTERVKFMKGLYSMEIPAEGWEHVEDEKGVVTVTRKNSKCASLVIMPPTPALDKENGKDDPAEIAGMLLRLMTKEFGNLKLGEEEKGNVSCANATTTTFAVTDEDGDAVKTGFVKVVMWCEAPSIIIALATECRGPCKAEDFLTTASAIVTSGLFNMKQMAKDEEKLIEMGEAMIKDIKTRAAQQKAE
jgi:hypothetical protein